MGVNIMSRLPKSIKSVGEIIKGPDAILQSLWKQSQQLLKLEQVVKPFLPDDVAVAALEDGLLTLITTSGNRATALRYHQQDIISALGKAEQKLPIKALKILVRPHYPATQMPDK